MAKVDTSLVAHLPLFGGVKPEDLEEILREARSVRYPKNSAIFEQGADAQSFFLLLHGHVRAAKTTPSGEQIAHLIWAIRPLTRSASSGYAAASCSSVARAESGLAAATYASAFKKATRDARKRLSAGMGRCASVANAARASCLSRNCDSATSRLTIR